MTANIKKKKIKKQNNNITTFIRYRWYTMTCVNNIIRPCSSASGREINTFEKKELFTRYNFTFLLFFFILNRLYKILFNTGRNDTIIIIIIIINGHVRLNGFFFFYRFGNIPSTQKHT